MNSKYKICYFLNLLLLCVKCINSSFANQFLYKPTNIRSLAPKLVLVSGCTGAGKSTFGMEVALSKGILKCISTDTVRQVLRTLDPSEALHRSSYSGTGDPVIQWRECCDVLTGGIDSLVTDSIDRGVSLVLEGVHIVPCNALIEKWKSLGGTAVGCVLVITNEQAHRELIFKRGEMMTKKAEQQMKAFNRIRIIQSEMIRLAQLNQWIIIEQQLQPDPVDIVTNMLDNSNNITV